jgi:hypothetical protein
MPALIPNPEIPLSRARRDIDHGNDVADELIAGNQQGLLTDGLSRMTQDSTFPIKQEYKFS